MDSPEGCYLRVLSGCSWETSGAGCECSPAVDRLLGDRLGGWMGVAPAGVWASRCHLTAGRQGAPPVVDPLVSLLRASHLLAPDDLASMVAAHARSMGARETVIYLADYEQATLVPLPGAGVPQRQELAIEATMAGRAFRRVEVVTSSATGSSYRLWVPLIDGVERLGVVELVLPAEPTPDLQEDLRALVSLVAELVVTKDAYGDVLTRLRRRKAFSLAAEIPWGALPPLTFGPERVVITGGLEPAYDIGGDTFDYAVNGDTADLLILDSVGHGLPAAVLASVAAGAYRHARRTMADLPEIAREVNTAIAGQWACKTPNPTPAKPAWSPVTACCSTPTASPKPAPRTGSSSASNAWPTSSPPPSPPAIRPPKWCGASCAMCLPTRPTNSKTTPASSCWNGAPARSTGCCPRASPGDHDRRGLSGRASRCGSAPRRPRTASGWCPG